MSSDHDQTIADCTEAIRFNPRDSSAYARRGSAYRMKGDYDRTIADCTEAIRLNPNEFTAFADRGVAHRMKGDSNRAIADCTEASRLKSLPGWKKDDGWRAGKDWWEWVDANKKRIGPMTLKEFTVLVKAKKITGATKVWNEGAKEWVKAEITPQFHAALGVTPKDVTAHVKRAEGYLEKKDYDRAIAECTEAIKLDPTNSSAYTCRGNAYRMKSTTAEEEDRAIADLTAAIMVDPNNSRTFALRGASYQLSAERVYDKCKYREGTDWLIGRYSKGIADLVEALRLRPDYPWAKNQLAETYALRAVIYFDWAKHFENAIADCTEAIRLEPTNAWAFAMRGVCHSHDDNSTHRNYDQAVADLTEAIRLCPKARHRIRTTPNPYFFRDIDYKRELADATKKAKKCKETRAIADLNEAIRLDPNNADAFAKRGTAYRMKGDYDRAIADCTEAIRIKSNQSSAFADRGISYREKGDYDRAIADLTEYIRLFTNDWGLEQRSRCYQKKGDYDRAIADLTEANRLNPTEDYKIKLAKAQKEAKEKLAQQAQAIASSSSSPKPAAAPAPSASWATGLYYCKNGSWYMVEADEMFESLVKAKAITLDTLFVIVPTDLVPRRVASHPVLNEAVQRILNQPSGFWKALKVAGLFAGFAAGSILKAVARYDAAPLGKALCLKCRNPVDPTATRCPFCQGDPREI